MSKVILIENIGTKISNANKKVKKDENGNYDVVVGAINCFNSQGEFYTARNVADKFFNENSKMMERVRNGYMRGEAAHPVYKPTMSTTEWFQRLYEYDRNRVAFVINNLWLEEIDEKSGNADSNIILIWAKIKPFGPMKAALIEELEDDSINTPFSIRSLTKVKEVNFITVKEITDIICFDWVSSPGIKKANTFYSSGIESDFKLKIENSIQINLNDSKTVQDLLNTINKTSSLESDINSEVLDLFKCSVCYDSICKW